MRDENQICQLYEPYLAAIAALDRRYYLNPAPTLADRAAYAARQTELEKLRARLYAELARSRNSRVFRIGRCRSIIRRRAPSRQYELMGMGPP
jgi:hypothetical protein